MRQKRTVSGLTVNAIAGTHVVLLGFDLDEERRKGCLGFAVQREDHTDDERVWMRGTKTFEATDPGMGPGWQVSSRDHPFQTFQWADYSAKPGFEYTYRVIPLYGKPEALEPGDAASVRIRTEPELGSPHSAFFNRGTVASQEYARRFQNKAPNELEGSQKLAAFRWLSRGLLEAFQAFVGRADGPRWGLFGAVYEFQWAEALAAVKKAADSGAQVRILYDGIPSASGPLARNQDAITAAGLDAVCIPRTTGKIMHNKFLVLTRDGQPVAVWTGSTNLTENGLYGHSNLGHIVDDPAVAAAYLAYWEEMTGPPSPTSSEERDWMAANNPNPPDPWAGELRSVFSPRRGLDVLEWYASLAGDGHKPLFMTFAFGMHNLFKAVYEQDDGVLRFALMEKEGNGRGLAQGRIDIARIRKLRNVVVAIGNNLSTNSFDRWLRERRALTAETHVRYIHTKYMLVDPLGPDPIVVTGSANFSQASTNTNNENMVVIRGDTRIADIYLGEFMRLYTHYAFREAVKIAKENGETEEWKPNYLIPSDKWQSSYFRKGGQRELRRKYFAGT